MSLCLAEILLQFYQLDLVSLCYALLPFAFDKLEKKPRKQNEAIVVIVTPLILHSLAWSKAITKKLLFGVLTMTNMWVGR